jgi:peroxin-3
MPNEYLQAMEGVQDLEGFAAVVYSSNWQAEIVGDEGSGVSSSVKGAGEERAGLKTSARARAQMQGEQELDVRQEESLVLVEEPAQHSSLFDSVWEKASSGR